MIFRQKILFDEESVPDLAEDQLFAMMLYKSTHLSDFEQIKMGKSRLDELYKDGRKLVAENIANLNFEAQESRQRINSLDSIATRSEKLGTGLLQYIERVSRHLGVSAQATRTVTFGGQTRSNDDLRSAGFWQEFIESESALDVVFTNNYYQQSHPFSISRADASEALGNSLSLDDWQENDRVKLKERLDEFGKAREFLAHADMGELMKDEEFKLKSSDGALRSFSELASEHLDSELARQLVEAGYINKDFTLYTSTYYAERVSSQATNFIIHNVDPNVTDAHFILTPVDVEAVLRERGDSVLRERGIYNIDVVDHLLEANDSRVDILVHKLTTFGDDEKSFLRAYFTGGEQREPLIRKLAERWRLTFNFIISEAEIDETVRGQLLNAALESMVEGLNYVVDEDVRAYFEEHYSELPVFTSSGMNAQAASLVTGLLTEMGARLASLAPLGLEMRRAVIAKSRYTITRDNLLTAIGGTQDLALDHVREIDPVVYDYILDHLPEYLGALQETQRESPTVETVDAFEAIIEDVLEHAEYLLPQVVAAASSECQVPNLADVSEAAWPVLAEHERFSATFENIKAYIDTIGHVDAPLAHLLTAAASIEEATESEEVYRAAIAVSLLAARDVLADAGLRTNLVLSLGLEDWLPVTSIQPESGHLIGLLIEKGIIEDDAASFSLTFDTDWPTREFAISKSTQFSLFMSSTEVPSGDVSPLVASTIVSEGVKKEIVHRFDEFVPNDDRKALEAIALFADRYHERLTIDAVSRLATSRVESQIVLRVLEPLLPELEVDQLAPVLRAIGGVYAEVSARNSKRPRLPNTETNLALVKRLEELGVISSHKVLDDKISASMKKTG